MPDGADVEMGLVPLDFLACLVDVDPPELGYQ
jgi:hypothetical protein